MSYSKASALIIDYLLTYGMSKVSNDQDQNGNPETYGGLTGFVSHHISAADQGKNKPIVGDLIMLNFCPKSEWRLSWLLEIDEQKQGGVRYRCKSITTGKVCWWSNVGISHLHRPTLERFPYWRWDDHQYAFWNKWKVVCRKNQTIFKAMRPEFTDAGVVIGVCERFGDGFKHTRTIEKWKYIPQRDLAAMLKKLIDLVASDLSKRDQ